MAANTKVVLENIVDGYLAEGKSIKGTYVVFQTLDERDAMSASTSPYHTSLVEGSTCYVVETDSVYKWRLIEESGSQEYEWVEEAGSLAYHDPLFNSGLKIAEGEHVSDLYVPEASTNQSGVINTGAQTFAGDKTFTGQVISDNTFNIINASDIVNNTLTPTQYALVTNGKPTRVIGTLFSITNGILSYYQTTPAVFFLKGSQTYGIIEKQINIDSSTLVMSAGSAYIQQNIGGSYRSYLINGIGAEMGASNNSYKVSASTNFGVEITSNSVTRRLPNYPTDSKAYFLEHTNGALAYVEDTKLEKAPDGTNNLIVDNKINTIYIPDSILGQLLYGGTFNASTALATLSSGAKERLGTTDNTITLTNDTTAITGYEANEGIYYITSDNGTFAGISFEVGDWLISTGTAWKKIDNTDAVTGVKGQAENNYRIGNINITPDNIGVSIDNTAGSESITVGASSDGTGTVTTQSKTLNVVTTDTDQTVTGEKTFTQYPIAKGITLKNNVLNPTGSNFVIDNDNGYNGKIRFGGKGIMFTASSVGPTTNSTPESLGSSGYNWGKLFLQGAILNGNQNTDYGIISPDTTNYTSNHIIATEDQINFKNIPAPASSTLTADELSNFVNNVCVLTEDWTIGSFTYPAGTTFTRPFAYSNTYRGVAYFNSKIYTYYITTDDNVFHQNGPNDLTIKGVANLEGDRISPTYVNSVWHQGNHWSPGTPDQDQNLGVNDGHHLWNNLYLKGIISDGNNNSYGLTIPDTTSYTENKTIATTEDVSSLGEEKADKVIPESGEELNGKLAGLDATGNLTNSDIAIDDVVTKSGTQTITGSKTFEDAYINIHKANGTNYYLMNESNMFKLKYETIDQLVFAAYTWKFGSKLYPLTDNSLDLGSSDYRWKDLYLSGTAYVNTINYDSSFLFKSGAGNRAELTSTLFRSFTNADLGSSTYCWKDLYISGDIKDGTNTYVLPDVSGTLNVTEEFEKSLTISSFPANFEYYFMEIVPDVLYDTSYSAEFEVIVENDGIDMTAGTPVFKSYKCFLGSVSTGIDTTSASQVPAPTMDIFQSANAVDGSSYASALSAMAIRTLKGEDYETAIEGGHGHIVGLYNQYTRALSSAGDIKIRIKVLRTTNCKVKVFDATPGIIGVYKSSDVTINEINYPTSVLYAQTNGTGFWSTAIDNAATKVKVSTVASDTNYYLTGTAANGENVSLYSDSGVYINNGDLHVTNSLYSGDTEYKNDSIVFDDDGDLYTLSYPTQSGTLALTSDMSITEESGGDVTISINGDNTTVVTIDTDQTITGQKTLEGTVTIKGSSSAKPLTFTSTNYNGIIGIDGTDVLTIGGNTLYPYSNSVYSLGVDNRNFNHIYFTGALMNGPKNGSYGLKLPDTTNYTEHKIIATTSDIPSVSLTTTTGSEAITVNGSTLNLVTRDTDQTITATKTFSAQTNINGLTVYTNKVRLDGTNGRIDDSILPYYDNDRSLGTSSYRWKDAYFSGNTYYYYPASGHTTYWSLHQETYDNLAVARNGSDLYKFGSQSVFASSNNARDLGTSSLQWKNLYLAGYLSNTNSGYGLVLPSTSGWTANKTIATMDDIPDVSDFVTKSTVQTITANKTFSGTLNPNSSDKGVVLPDTSGYSANKTLATTDYVQANQSGVADYTLSSININGVKYAIEQGTPCIIDDTPGSESVSDGLESGSLTLNVVTRDTDQEISGKKSFTNSSGLIIKTRDDYKWALYTTSGGANLGVGYYASNNNLQNRYILGNSYFGPANNSMDLGYDNSSNRWRHLYLSGNLSDGTNSIAVADIQHKLTAGTGITITDNTITCSLDGIDYEFYNELPATGRKGVIYLIPNGESGGEDIYYEYIWIPAQESGEEGRFEFIGTTQTDISNLVTLDTNQTITGDKTFEGDNTFTGTNTFKTGSASYGVTMPTTTSYSADKTLATTDYVVANPAGATTKLTGLQVNGVDYYLANGTPIIINATAGSEYVSYEDGTPVNIVTRDTEQTISAQKTFTNKVLFNGTIDSDMIPDDDATYDLGSYDETSGGVISRWKDMYLSGSLNLGTPNVSLQKDSSDNRLFVNIAGATKLKVGASSSVFAGHLTPDSNSTYNLGSGSLSWNNLQLTGLIKNGNVTYGLELPTMSSWTANKTIATTDDLPTVNDATLTITQNDTSVGTFTANAATATTINITTTQIRKFI